MCVLISLSSLQMSVIEDFFFFLSGCPDPPVLSYKGRTAAPSHSIAWARISQTTVTKHNRVTPLLTSIHWAPLLVSVLLTWYAEYHLLLLQPHSSLFPSVKTALYKKETYVF